VATRSPVVETRLGAGTMPLQPKKESGALSFERPIHGQVGNEIIPAESAIQTFEWNSAVDGPSRGVFAFNSKDIRSRPFNLLRTQILKIAKARDWRLFGIVSAAPNAGKSFIATNLSAALSRTPGLQVYLVDFDLRKSSIGHNFGLGKEVGIQRFLSGEVSSLSADAFRLSTENLIVIPGSKSSSPSAELLSNHRLDKFVDAMRQQRDNSIFICDLPPAFACDDASIVAAKLDAYLMVVEEGQTTKKQIREAIRMLSPAVCAGTILNRYNGGIFSDDYGYGYGRHAYGDYYGE
jgi:protein-tyrosine kinase